MSDEGLKSRMESMGNSILFLEQRNRDLQAKVMLLEAQKEQWESEKVKQASIIQRTIDASNAVNNGSNEEITRLRQELKSALIRIKELEGGVIN